MIEQIERLARAAERDADVAALCLTGEGRAFCAGLDMSALQDSVGEALLTPAADDPPSSPALFSFLLDISKPVIAAVNGVTAGGGSSWR
jgi:enoyl-CoA hydratase/carnithine racemase